MQVQPAHGNTRILTQEEEDHVLNMIADGETTRKVREYLGINASTWMKILERSPLFHQAVMHSQSLSLEDLADSLLEIPDQMFDVQKAKLKSDNIKFLLSKRKPQVYGDRIDLNVNGTVDLRAALNDAERRISLPPSDLGNIIETQVVKIKERSTHDDTDEYTVVDKDDIFT